MQLKAEHGRSVAEREAMLQRASELFVEVCSGRGSVRNHTSKLYSEGPMPAIYGAEQLGRLL